MTRNDLDELFPLMEEFRNELAKREKIPELKQIAGGLILVLIEAWPHLSDQWRDVFITSVVSLESRGGGNAATELADEISADALRRARELLGTIGRRRE